mgnify:FL=1
MASHVRLWKKETLTRDTILRLAVSPFTLVAAHSSPYFLHRLVKLFFKDRSVKIIRQRTKKLRELESKKIVRFQKLANDSLRLALTPMGEALADNFFKQTELENIRVSNKRWTGLWYLLIYDLAGCEKKTKDIFRKTIKKLGLYPMKRTVWVSPFDCEREIKKLCNALDINQEKIIYTTTKKLSGENKVKAHFKI